MSRLFASLLALAAAASGPDVAAATELTPRAKTPAPDAHATLVERVRTHPADAEAHHQLGRLLLTQNDYAGAIPLLEKAAALAPTNAEFVFHYGAACAQHAEQLGKTFRALALGRRGRIALEKAVELAPAEGMYHFGLIEFYSRAPAIAGGSLGKARAHAEAYRDLVPRDGAIALAGVHLRAKDFTAAFALYNQLLALAPDDYQVLYLLGRAAADSGEQLDRGIAALRRCLSLAPPPRGVPHAMVSYHLGRALQQTGAISEAREAYQAALSLEPAYGEAQSALNALP